MEITSDGSFEDDAPASGSQSTSVTSSEQRNNSYVAQTIGIQRPKRTSNQPGKFILWLWISLLQV